MFVENVKYKKIGKGSGVITTYKGRYAVIGDDGYSQTIACKLFSNENTLYLNSFFISGFSGSNYAGEKGTAHYTTEMIKAVCELDKSFIVVCGKAKSSYFDIKVVEFGRDNAIEEDYKYETNS